MFAIALCLLFIIRLRFPRGTSITRIINSIGVNSLRLGGPPYGFFLKIAWVLSPQKKRVNTIKRKFPWASRLKKLLINKNLRFTEIPGYPSHISANKSNKN